MWMLWFRIRTTAIHHRLLEEVKYSEPRLPSVHNLASWCCIYISHWFNWTAALRYLLTLKVQNKVHELFQDSYLTNGLSKRQALIYCYLNGEVLTNLGNTVLPPALTTVGIVITFLEITVGLGMGFTPAETPWTRVAMHWIYASVSHWSSREDAHTHLIFSLILFEK